MAENIYCPTIISSMTHAHNIPSQKSEIP
ncbi:protein of unknown function (plasmid) [Cupriavidus taiwanensis]|uniref:Uncharacterized protein n=1 Tax=Cupriavidus taiwanensis TaxID=164546 RepID=A0A7Z7JDR2_9BURK|nr:hypothetical protein CBM2585_B80290 [Cupriavidus taiwanensis]SOZ10415.1 protein of unknown function [Cupriavidus taiwanensis]SOZ12586.1 protein of unknown function [Cupriavidus taiwanensis]SOZ43943.1 protein of unknown function [Cupriavidus taiwanensis]SPC23133.1 protein of unknown function [Cupriavidus taiwanensis]